MGAWGRMGEDAKQGKATPCPARWQLCTECCNHTPASSLARFSSSGIVHLLSCARGREGGELQDVVS